MPFYACKPLRVARLEKLQSELATLRATKNFTPEIVDRVWNIQDEIRSIPRGPQGGLASPAHADPLWNPAPPDAYDIPELATKVRCRWTVRQFDENGNGLVQTDEKIQGLQEVDYKSTTSNEPWHHPDSKVEKDPTPIPEITCHLAKNHCLGNKMSFAELRTIAAGMYEKLQSKDPEDLNAVARLQMVMREKPLGQALEDEGAELAADILRVTNAPVPFTIEEEFLEGYGEKPKKDSTHATKDTLAGKYPTLDKIPGWTPTNAYTGLIKNTYNGAAGLLSWQDNTVKHARTFTVGSNFTLGAIHVSMQRVGTLPAGALIMKLYAGTPAAPGNLLGTGEISTLEIGAAVASYAFGLGNGINLTTTQGTYFYELSTSIALSVNNYISLAGINSGGVAGDQNWIYSGGSWASNSSRYGYMVTDNSDGGYYVNRADSASSTLLTISGPKGAASSATDKIILTMGATLTVDGNHTFLKFIYGDGFTGAGGAGSAPTDAATGINTNYMYGFINFGAGTKTNFGTGGGCPALPSAYQASMSNSGFTISGTSGSHTVFTNKTDALVWADNYYFNMYYCNTFSIGYIDFWYPFMSSNTLWMNDPGTYTAYTTLNSVSMGYQYFYGYWNGQTGIWMSNTFYGTASPNAHSLTVELLYFDFTEITGNTITIQSFQTTAISQTGTHLYKAIGAKQAVAPAALNVVTVCPGAGRLVPPSGQTVWVGPIRQVNSNTTQPAQLTTPTGLVMTNTGYGKSLSGTITNIASYADTDFFEVATSADVMVARFTKARYVAQGNVFYTTPVLTDNVAVQLKIRASSDNILWSDWSALADAATPTHTGWDFPAVGNTYNDTVDGVPGTCTLPDPGVVQQGTATFGNPASPKTPTLAMLTAQDIADAMKLTPSAGAAAPTSVLGILGSVETVTDALWTMLASAGGGVYRFSTAVLQSIRDAVGKLAPGAGDPDTGSIDSNIASVGGAVVAVGEAVVEVGGAVDEVQQGLASVVAALPTAEPGAVGGLPILDAQSHLPETENTARLTADQFRMLLYNVKQPIYAGQIEMGDVTRFVRFFPSWSNWPPASQLTNLVVNYSHEGGNHHTMNDPTATVDGQGHIVLTLDDEDMMTISGKERGALVITVHAAEIDDWVTLRIDLVPTIEIEQDGLARSEELEALVDLLAIMQEDIDTIETSTTRTLQLMQNAQVWEQDGDGNYTGTVYMVASDGFTKILKTIARDPETGLPITDPKYSGRVNYDEWGAI